MTIRRLPLLSYHPSMRPAIAMHFRDNTDRNGKQNKDIDGCTAHDIVEVDGGHDLTEPSRIDDRGRDLFVALSGKSSLEDAVRPSRPIHGRNVSAGHEAGLQTSTARPRKLVSRR
jgi:hypothetical protein